MNLHPGAEIALRRLGMNELDIARAMAAGDLASPQLYYNVTLYNLRITGTSVSYRPQHDEFCYRRPEDYLTDEFLARCNGLPVIMVHPGKGFLNSEEFAQRIVGTMFLPYIKDDEVWGIAKIYDDATISLLKEEQMSTSPAVLLGKNDTILRTEDGSKLLVEGDARLLDHLAIVRAGVWDKEGEPNGIEADIRKDSVMAEMDDKEKKEREEKERSDAARMDADKRMDEKFDLLLKGVDSLRSDISKCNERMDSFDEEKQRKDAAEKEEREKMAADKSRKDGKDNEGDEKENPEDAKARELAADKARKDSEEKESRERMDSATADLRKLVQAQSDQIAALASRIPKPATDSDYGDMVQRQVRADDVYMKFGERAPVPVVGEAIDTYERRLVKGLQKHSERWKGIDLDGVRDDAFTQMRDQIYTDAATASRRPNDLAKGRMVPRTRQTGTGHMITEFVGNDTHFVRQFARPPRVVDGFTIPDRR